MRLSRTKEFNFRDKVVQFEEDQQNMYLITEGNAFLFQNEYAYDKY